MNTKIKSSNSLNWIGIKHDDKEYIQSQNINKHKKIAGEAIKKKVLLTNVIVQKKK